MEAINAYGWGYTGSDRKGFEWLIVYGSYYHERIVSGHVYKTEAEALKAGREFLKKANSERYNSGTLSAIPARPKRFEY